MAEGSVKQRLAAVLAADVAGYSRLMGDDERATIATLDEYRAVLREHIESNDGRVIDMAGDSVLAVFDSANAAVRAAIDAQAELGKRNEALSDGRRMEFRIGVNSGDIQEKSDGTVYGDGVNVAARLEAMANPGGINVSGSVFDSVRSKIGTPFDFLGEHEVKNIAEPVRAYRVLGKGEKVAPHRDRRVPLFAAGIAAFVLLAVGLGSWWLTWDAPTPEGAGAENIPPALPDKPSIAVLSFENLNADAAHDYLSEGMTEEIISALSHFRKLFVIARSSTSGYDGKDIDIRQVARELGVRYVLDGSIRASGDKLRVSAQLVDAADGSQAWSQSYERSLTDIFAVQSDIAGRIATILVPKFKLEVYARTRSTPTIELTAYEHVVRALRYWDNETPETHLEARNLLESVRRLYVGLQSFRSMSRMDASLMKASALRLRFSQSLASRRQRLSQAMVRSTTQRLGWTTKPFTRSDRLTISVSRSGRMPARAR